MHFVTFNVDGTDWVRRTQVLAGTATDALLFVDDGNEQDFFSWNLLSVGIFPTPSILMDTSLQRHHLYCLSGALTVTKSTMLLVLDRNAEVACPYGVSYLNGSPFFYGDGLYGRGRADL